MTKNNLYKRLPADFSRKIGAKIATKVLKDGDLVEVDANKGIVEIINK
jgi:hypothetical protein